VSDEVIHSFLAVIVSFVKDGIDKNGNSRQQSFLIGGGVLWKIHVECRCIREEFDRHALWLFQNDAQVGIIRIGGSTGISRINSKGTLATSLPTTRISLGTTIDTNSPETGGRMDQIQLISGVVVDLHGRDAKPTRFLDAAQIGAVALDTGLLVATAFAAPVGTPQGAFDGDNFFVGIELFYDHSIWMARSTADSAETTSIFEGLEDLLIPDKIFELCLGLTSKTVL